MLMLLQIGREGQALGLDQSSPSEEISKRSLIASSAILDEARSGTTVSGRNQRLKYTPVIH
jgi:hypothetical protein